MVNKNNSLANQLKNIDELINFLKHYKQALKEQATYVKGNITEYDLRGFFMKFNVAALDSFDTIFKYIKQDNIQDIKRIKNEVRQLKYIEENLKTKNYKKTFSKDKINENISTLNDQQLEILHTFISEAVQNLDLIIYLPEEYITPTDTLYIKNAPYKEICSILNNAELEQENRRIKNEVCVKSIKGDK